MTKAKAKTKTRTRFGPSPTGKLHAGGARTALFNRLFASHSGGTFILRIEDTDRTRSTPEFEESIMEDLRWLGLDWDEGPGKDSGGDFGPYRQSERAGLYEKEAARLLTEGKAYKCCCTARRLKELKKEQTGRGEPSRYDGRCRPGVSGAVPEGVKGAEYVLRFKVDSGPVEFDDGVHGKVSVEPAKAGGDFIIIGSDKVATYNFAAAVDDALMEITDVIRGDDHLANTPRQILLTRALGYDVPRFYHLPLVLAEDGKPLSKRHMGTAVAEMRDAGFLPGAVVNAAAKLGWAPGDGVYSLNELSESFDGKGLSKSASVFDSASLKWANREVLSKGGEETVEYVKTRIGDGFCPLGVAWINEAVKASVASAGTIDEVAELMEPLAYAVDPDEWAREVLKGEGVKEVLKALAEEVAEEVGVEGDLDGDKAGALLERMKKRGFKGKALFMPVRAALTGRVEGLEVDTTLRLIGRAEILKRVGEYIR